MTRRVEPALLGRLIHLHRRDPVRSRSLAVRQIVRSAINLLFYHGQGVLKRNVNSVEHSVDFGVSLGQNPKGAPQLDHRSGQAECHLDQGIERSDWTVRQWLP